MFLNVIYLFSVRNIVIEPTPAVDWKTLPMYLAQAIYDAETERSQKSGGTFKLVFFYYFVYLYL